ncbi:MAG TPA: acyl-CoA dehydrogenase [Gammaproteobacteria bacterium]|nr:acyl-CoA dehydrogenase [Gammaproteobacteria bacterium]
MTYHAPMREIRFVLETLGGLARLRELGAPEAPDDALAAAVLDEAARFAEQELAPLYRLADERGAAWADGRVQMAPEIVSAYRRFAEAGWPGMTAPAEHGGQALPEVLGIPAAEMWRSANLAFALCPMLTRSAIEALVEHGSSALKARYLPKLVSGEWTGTMNLTEPQAGSDLAAIETRAEPRAGHYLLRGRKIFITWGDHDLAENIVHLVLARSGPPGSGHRGLSLFAVPKFLPAEDGGPGERNDIVTVSLEHKLGIRGSPTCVLSYGDGGGAVGHLVGAEGEGLACMFTMMNRARLAVGVEGLGLAERAYQQARAYARERVQGKPPGADRAAPIWRHPDVRRMLLLMKAATEAMRWLAYTAALESDFAARAPDTAVAARAAARVALLTPIVKGWCTELAQEVVSLGVQVHGGAGYIEDTGAAQILRDARITTIYEGTTGIQALDLARRKLLGDEGRTAFALCAEIGAWCEERRSADALPRPVARGLAEGLRLVDEALRFLLARHREDPSLAGAVSFNMLMLFGTVLGAWSHARAAAEADRRLSSAADGERGFLEAKRATAVFYAEHLLPRARAYAAAVMAGSEGIMAIDEADL